MTVGACIVQRNQTTLVLGVDITTMFNHQFYHPYTVVPRCQVEGGALCGCGVLIDDTNEVEDDQK